MQTPDTPADSLFIAVAQLNPTVGDVAGNLGLARRTAASAREAGADLVVFPELFLSGYPPEDLVLMSSFQAACRRGVETLAAETVEGPSLLVGAPWVEEGRLFNSMLLLEAGAIAAVRHKVELQRSGAFDEARVFSRGPLPGPIAVRGVRLGVLIGDDIRIPDVAECLAETGAEILLAACAWPHHRNALAERDNAVVARVVESQLPLLLVNQVGGQDELVFDGHAFALNADRFLALQFPGFMERVRLSRWQRFANGWRCLGANMADRTEGDAADYWGCVIGLRDHVEKNGLPGVVLDLSGGVGSAVAAAMAVDALGAERVHALTFPGQDTAGESHAVAAALGIRSDALPIAAVVERMADALAPLRADASAGAADEDLQSRARDALLTASSSMIGALALATADKSELCTGEAPPVGAFAPLKDVYRSEVIRLARLRNRWRPADAMGPDGPVIPEKVIAGGDSAWPRAGREQSSGLPGSDVLDAILERLVEGGASSAEVVAEGFESAAVARVADLLRCAEGARRRSPPGVAVAGRAFGRGRRYPITNRFREG